MSFMIVGMRKSIPYIVKAVPDVKIEGVWLAEEIDSVIESLHNNGIYSEINKLYFPNWKKARVKKAHQ